MKIYLSPNITDDQISKPLTFENKIRLFHDRFYGWKFLVAQQMLDGYTAANGTQIPAIPESGYAAMDVMFSYFEPVGKYVSGYCDTDLKYPRASGKYFKIGVRNVFPDLDRHPKQNEIETLLSMLWKGVRCGLYHGGQTQGQIAITGDIQEPIRIDPQAKVMFLNPHVLVRALMAHLDAYRNALLTEGPTSTCGKRFEARYAFDNK
jgi:hypothetical protein